jgi:hypothetical protein
LSATITRQIRACNLDRSLPSNSDDHVARLDRAVVDGAATDDAGDQRARALSHAEALGDLVGHRLNAHAEPAAAGFAELAQLVDDIDSPASAGIAKPMPIEPPDGEMIAVLMPMTSPDMLNSGTAGIAAVDGGVGLDEIVVGAGIDVASAGRDDPHSHRVPPSPNGIADGHHPVAHAHLRRMSPKGTAVSGLSPVSTFSTAMSVLGSVPTSSASSFDAVERN